MPFQTKGGRGARGSERVKKGWKVKIIPGGKVDRISLRSKEDRSQVIPNHCVIWTTPKLVRTLTASLHQSFGTTVPNLIYKKLHIKV